MWLWDLKSVSLCYSLCFSLFSNLEMASNLHFALTLSQSDSKRYKTASGSIRYLYFSPTQTMKLSIMFKSSHRFRVRGIDATQYGWIIASHGLKKCWSCDKDVLLVMNAKYNSFKFKKKILLLQLSWILYNNIIFAFILGFISADWLLKGRIEIWT